VRVVAAKRGAAFGVLALVLCCTTPLTPAPPSQTSAAPSVAVSSSPALLSCPAVRPISLGAISGRISYPSTFTRLTGRAPKGAFDNQLLPNRRVVFREASSSGFPKVEVTDFAQKFLEKITFK
jgi:hypothetical protein